ncbi:hypothetical protein KPH14_005030 [Odynerus spinipes]|uniref:Guanylate cyclase domain-containing protein n=1 Tax=Odynerus spinipes TaxID=1348599 RepID=A0AAD9RN25_9HYME|nr:hypothetical protein KPH14_005030 [Odynerus spinipes]
MKKLTPADSYSKPVWTPEVYGSLYGKGSLAVTEALNIQQTNKCSRIMATFVPNEIVQAKDLTKKIVDKFDAILLLVDISGFSILYKRYSNAENGGSSAFTVLLNKYVNVIAEEVYSSGGDVFKFSQNGILSLWRLQQDELILNVMPKVISSAFRLQTSIGAVKEGEEIMAKIFSIIGGELSRHYVLAGDPISQLKKAKKVCLPGDLVLSMNAWEHCTHNRYEYVIKDLHNIKIIRVLQDEKYQSRPSIRPLHSSISTRWDRKTLRRLTEMLEKKSADPNSQNNSSSSDENTDVKEFTVRSSVVEAIKKKLGAQLKAYLISPVAEQIVQDLPLSYLMERRRITTICIDIVPANCTNYELISLVDKCYLLLHGIIDKHAASICLMNLYDKDVLFYVAFGLEESTSSVEEITKSGIVSAFNILQALKSKHCIRGVSIGVSTGMVYCGVIGHISRREYVIIGIPVDKAMRMMEISYDKVSCDYDTVMYSRLSRSRFRSRGVKDLKKIGKYHVYEFLGIPSVTEMRENISSVHYRYPILDRDQELETFNDILDNIGVLDRDYSGMLIMGDERSGKSRLLDAFVTRAENRQINVIKLPLHFSYAEKEHSTMYQILLQIFDAEDCKSIKDRERAVMKKLRGLRPSNDFCYLNTIMKVRFALSKEYCTDNDWMRHIKTMEIFGTLLNQCGKMCIFLDDFHYTDPISWQFISLALDNANIVTVITALTNVPFSVKFDVEENLAKDRRLIKKNLKGLDTELLTPFACQFLNVVAIPNSLDVVLKKHSNNDIGWCEAFLSATLQTDGLEFRIMTASELTQYNLVFPETALVTKVPSELLPEDLIPSPETNSFPICITNEKYIGFVDGNYDCDSLKQTIYYRMNSYEQEFLKCAAAVGRFFARTIVQTVMLNSTAVHTAKSKSIVL